MSATEIKSPDDSKDNNSYSTWSKDAKVNYIFKAQLLLSWLSKIYWKLNCIYKKKANNKAENKSNHVLELMWLPVRISLKNANMQFECIKDYCIEKIQFKCNLCESKMLLIDNMKQHRLINKVGKQYQCKKCSKVFT